MLRLKYTVHCPSLSIDTPHDIVMATLLPLQIHLETGRTVLLVHMSRRLVHL